jgi:hypothetical protein
MARQIEDEVKYYYDSHSTEEDLMGETLFHRVLVHYLIDVLTWLFHGQHCVIHGNLKTCRADAATARAEAEARRSQMLLEKMRALGIDPDQLI